MRLFSEQPYYPLLHETIQTFLKHTLCARQLIVIYIPAHGHLQTSGQRFEDSFDLMMFVDSLGFDVQVHSRAITQALEEMEEHFRRHVPYPLTAEFGIPDEPRAAAEIEGHGTEAVVHRQTVAIAFDAAFVAERTEQTIAKGNRRVLNRVVFVDVEVAACTDCQIYHAMTPYLFEHVVEKAKSGGDVAAASAVKIDTDTDIGLGRGTHDLCRPFAGKEQFGNLIPRHAVAAEYE